MNTLICVAAGLSSRMGTFKPLLPLDDSTIIRTLITRYQSCGIEQIILVTGHNANLLEEHVSDLNILCRRNDSYSTSDMLESVKIGIRTCLAQDAKPSQDSRILLTPGDIPLVRTDTITKMLETTDDICMPTFGGKTGHPLRLSCRVLEPILAYEGEGGLRGALDSLSFDVATIPVDDPGILLDADTPEDYEALKHLITR